MADFGVQPTGFIRKSLDTIKTEIEQELRSRLGNGINLLPQVVFGNLIGVFSDRESSVWQVAEAVYNAAAPDTAFNAQLDDVVALTGITRKAATFSTLNEVFLFGTAATLVPAGTIFSVIGVPTARFVTDTDVTLVAGTDEVQDITFDATPDAGSFKLKYFDETTVAILFSEGATEVEAALNALTNLSGVTVSGSFAAGFTVTFAGADGKQPQPLLLEDTNVLVIGATPVVITIAETTPGVAQGIAQVTAESTGPVQASAFSLVVIDTPVGGLASVRNQKDADIGQNIETDTELKIRREEELQKAGAATVEAIRAEVSALDNVTAVVVFQNNTDIVDLEGRPPHSVEVVVQGGDDDEIALEIFETVAAGIETVSSSMTPTVIFVTDSQGFSQLIRFSRPTEVEIHLEVDLTVDANFFPANGVALAENNLVTFGNSLGIGRKVITIPELLCALRGDPTLGLDSIPGITDVVIRIGTAPSPTLDNNIPIAADEIADFDTARTTVITI